MQYGRLVGLLRYCLDRTVYCNIIPKTIPIWVKERWGYKKMQVSSKGRYAVFAAMQIAMRYGQGPVSIKVLAESVDISYKYLEYLVTMLKRGGITRSTRGSKGGHFLAAPPSEIKLSEIMTALDGPDMPARCVRHEKFAAGCVDCVLRALFAMILKKRSKLLESVTLQDIVDICQGVKKDIG
jgi:Rrf2 family cysteine metabolism transcriptional repressor